MSDAKQQNCGIYKIENLIDGKVYIGQSVNISNRWKSHKSYTRKTIKECPESNKPLYNSMRKYGIENFSFEVIEPCSPEELDDKEVYWIKYYDSFNNGYNLTQGGQNKPHLYNYEEIYKKWEEGFLCKELEEIYNCGDQVITSALRAYGVSAQEVRQRVAKKKPIVALSMDGKPLKIFKSSLDASLFFYKKESAGSYFMKVIRDGQSLKGFRWEYLNENNTPKEEITDEEFLSYQRIGKAHQWTQEEREVLSKANRTVERPSREELKELIRKLPFTQIAKKYGVSDNAIRKWCDFEKLPRKKTEINSYSDEEWEKI